VELGAERIVEGDSDVVNGRLRILVEFLVYTNGVGELDRWEG
jgi:hypothetical protein